MRCLPRFSSPRSCPTWARRIFTVMSRLANEHGAINLSQGFPDFDCDPALVDAVARTCAPGTTSTRRCRACCALREAIAAKYDVATARRYDPDTEVTVTSGAHRGDLRRRAAVVQPGRRGRPVRALLRLVRAGDRVERRHAGLRAAALSRLHGRLGRGAARDHAAHAADPDQLAAQPDGMRAGPPTTCAQLDRARRRHAASCIVSDEVYEHIIFDGLPHESMPRYPTSSPRAASSSARSARRITRPAGRSATAVAPAALTAEFRKVHQFVTFATTRRSQYAIAEFVATRRGLRRARSRSTRRSATCFLRADGRVALQAARLPRQLLPADGLLGDHRRDATRTSPIRLTKEHGVASIPTSPFLYRHRRPRCCASASRRRTRRWRARRRD